MSNEVLRTIFLYLGLTEFGALIIWLGVGLYMAYTEMDEMLERLKNCPAIMNRASLKRRASGEAVSNGECCWSDCLACDLHP